MSDIECYCDYDPATFYHKEIRRARLPHHCHECHGIILPGEQYEHVCALWRDYSDTPDTFKTCERCVDLRTWVKNNVPCLCWMHGDADTTLRDAVDDAHGRAGSEVAGLRFGLLRRMHQRDMRNAAVRERYGIKIEMRSLEMRAAIANGLKRDAEIRQAWRG